jgi:hypothetical protein
MVLMSVNRTAIRHKRAGKSSRIPKVSDRSEKQSSCEANDGTGAADELGCSVSVLGKSGSRGRWRVGWNTGVVSVATRSSWRGVTRGDSWHGMTRGETGGHGGGRDGGRGLASRRRLLRFLAAGDEVGTGKASLVGKMEGDREVAEVCHVVLVCGHVEVGVPSLGLACCFSQLWERLLTQSGKHERHLGSCPTCRSSRQLRTSSCGRSRRESCRHARRGQGGRVCQCSCRQQELAPCGRGT